jgi:multidrug efflux pump subunit AcrB
MCPIASIVGVVLRGQDNNILTQVGFIVLIGLAAKNAILIVEFAKQLEDQGRDRIAAAVEAARLRLRPILMTSLAFIFGVSPMVWAVGAGAELRQTLGTTVFSGMIGVTIFGLIFTRCSMWSALRGAHAAASPGPRNPSGRVMIFPEIQYVIVSTRHSRNREHAPSAGR